MFVFKNVPRPDLYQCLGTVVAEQSLLSCLAAVYLQQGDQTWSPQGWAWEMAHAQEVVSPEKELK